MPLEELPEPYGSLLAFLADLHEQVEIQLSAADHPNVISALNELRRFLEAAGLVVREMGR